MLRSNHVLCVLVHFVSWESETSILVVEINDLEVVDLYCECTKCIKIVYYGMIYCRESGEVAFHVYPGIYREEAIMLLREFYLLENQNGINALNQGF
jgi:hypothetical protein